MAETKKQVEKQIEQQLLSVTKHLDTTKRVSIEEAVTKDRIVSCFDERSLHAFMLTCKHNQNKYADKKVAQEMLHCVLNPTEPNQARFLELLSTPKRDLKGQPLYLIKNHADEVYFNKAKVKKTKTTRKSTNVLEAILRTQNFHLAKTLFNCIPVEDKTKSLKKYIKDTKALGIWGMPELKLAYNNFIDSWKALYDAENWDGLAKLWGRIGQALKEHLSWFSIYLFCHPATHANTNYTLPPKWVCILYDDLELDLDSFGADSIYALYKGGAGSSGMRGPRGRGSKRFLYTAAVLAPMDLEAYSSQCEVLSKEMDKTIKQFDCPELDVVKKAAPTG